MALVLFISACLVVGGGWNTTSSAEREDQPSVVRVGTWNIEWLGTPEKRHRGSAMQKPDDLAKYIVASKVDILCLNEITEDTEVDGVAMNSTLAKTLQKMKEMTGKEWKHMLFPKEDRTEHTQLCGVAWNADRVKLIGQPVRVPLRRAGRGGEFWRRHPYAVKFSFGEGKTDIVVVSVHMKSNVGGNEETGRVRADEAKALVRSLGAIQNAFSDDDVVILGDMNCRKGNELAVTRYAAAGFRDLNAGDTPTWIKDKEGRYEPAPFDRILVPDDQPEFRASALVVFKQHQFESEQMFRDRLSDHYLVVTEVRVMEDDD